MCVCVCVLSLNRLLIHFALLAWFKLPWKDGRTGGAVVTADDILIMYVCMHDMI